LNKQANQSLTKKLATKYIYGEWQLAGMITMVPTNVIPDIKVVFKDVLGAPIDKQIAEYYENGKLLGSTLYTLNQIENGEQKMVEIKSDVEIFDNQVYNLFRGNIRICENELMIDNGIAFDAPGYLFRRKK
jgi:hypothetical protein